MKVDLFLDGEMGEWTVRNCPHEARVISRSSQILKVAEKRGFETFKDHRSIATGEIGWSVHYPKIFSQAFLGRYRAIYNVHPGYLPWGRGWYPVFWALWNDEPAGATVHQVTAKLDGGPILDQISVPKVETDTGDSLLRRVRHAEKALIIRYLFSCSRPCMWPVRATQEKGSYHDKKDFARIVTHDFVRNLPAGQVFKLRQCLEYEKRLNAGELVSDFDYEWGLG